MKKNKIMRLASALLVLTLMTTCAISSTFAKYTTSTTGSDKARVAYWGFDQGANTTLNLFSKTYDNVVGAEKVVAPGTSGNSSFAFGYTNNDGKNITAPEVAYDLTVDVKTNPAADYKALDENKDFTWTLTKKKGETATTVGTYQTVADLTAALKNLSGDASGTKRYTAGQLPADFTSADETYTIGWNWAFEDNNKTAAQDATDTDMGNAQTLDNVELTITITATQVD